MVQLQAQGASSWGQDEVSSQARLVGLVGTLQGAGGFPRAGKKTQCLSVQDPHQSSYSSTRAMIYPRVGLGSVQPVAIRVTACSNGECIPRHNILRDVTYSEVAQSAALGPSSPTASSHYDQGCSVYVRDRAWLSYPW